MAADGGPRRQAAGSGDSTLLIQLAREPVAGQVKTRLLSALTPAQACELHCELVEWVCKRLLQARLGPVTLAVTGGPSHPLFRRCLALGVQSIDLQQGGDLGGRMARAISAGLQEYKAVLLVGSDCPGMDAAYLQRARAALEREPVVLGPATDGGYVLVGTRVDRAEMFEDIPWGTDEVMCLTRRRLRDVGLSWLEMEPLVDIDVPQDLPLWEALKGAQQNCAG
jgi:rSAM/selenodomain-associated transferase 1